MIEYKLLKKYFEKDDKYKTNTKIGSLKRLIELRHSKCNGTLDSTPCDLQNCGNWDNENYKCKIRYKVTKKNIPEMVEETIHSIVEFQLGFWGVKQLKYPTINFHKLQELLLKEIKKRYNKYNLKRGNSI